MSALESLISTAGEAHMLDSLDFIAAGGNGCRRPKAALQIIPNIGVDPLSQQHTHGSAAIGRGRFR